jgi:hypothetical protein
MPTQTSNPQYSSFKDSILKPNLATIKRSSFRTISSSIPHPKLTASWGLHSMYQSGHLSTTQYQLRLT